MNSTIYSAQLYKKGKFKRYLCDNLGRPFMFNTKPEAYLFSQQYLKIRNKKSLTIKVIESTIELPTPTCNTD